jgi:cytochrome oxidase Cu insertion factor (SCO1/SenC/PrrC family)
MPGMGRSVQTGNSLIVSGFHSALWHQLLVVFFVFLACAVAFNIVRTVQYRKLRADGQVAFPTSGPVLPEPLARRLLRFGFGALWILDGLLQAQSSMPLGLPTGVIEPSASSSPAWVHHIVNSGVTIWTDHPIQAAAATVWIQVGLGIWLLVAPRGRWSRLGGAASAAWGLVVWVFGESLGGVLSPGLTWLYGAPGAVLFYVAAGILVALPERTYATPRLGRLVVRSAGVFLMAMALLQAWPGRGFWQGKGGALSAMVDAMAKTPQPGFLSSWVSSFADFASAHGWEVNLFVVVALGTIGALFITARRTLVFGALVAFVVLCVADWVLVEDLGFLGGVGTDPNSMVPMMLLFVAGYVAMVRLPAAVDMTASEPAAGATASPFWWQHATLPYVTRTLAAVAAVGVVVIGTAPMAMAAVDRNADPILTEALDGTPNALDSPAPPFTLTDQHGHPVSLASLHGHVVALTFLDPVCTSDCPLIAQEFRATDQQLGGLGARVDFVAIVANPIYRSTSFTRAFDRQEGLTHLTNWHFLTGEVPQLRDAWNAYGALVQTLPGGAMVAHSDLAFVIDGKGRERDALVDDPGPTQAYASSFSALLLSRIDQALNL